MKKVIGIDRRIKRHWLDLLLDRFVRTSEDNELRLYLDEQLKSELPGAASRKKTVGILLKTWSGVPEKSISLRQRAVALLPQISGHERIWLHWGMMSLAYPFFRDTAEVVGRLLALQDDFTSAAVQSRLTGTWGDRVTTKMAAQYLLRTLVDWEVLRTARKPGHFLLVQRLRSGSSDLQLWLLEALLRASTANEIEAQQLLRLPEAFPFTINIGVADLRRHEGFNIHRQGLDMDMVALRPVRIAVPAPSTELPTPAVFSPEKPERHRRTTLFDEIGEAPGLEMSASTGKKSSRAKAEKIKKTAMQRRIEKQLREEFALSLDERIDRWLSVGQVESFSGPYAQPLAECCRQYRDGYFFGCLVLSRELLEVIVLAMAQSQRKKTPSRIPAFEKNVETLRKKQVISDELSQKLLHTWSESRAWLQTCNLAVQALATTSLTLLTQLQQLVDRKVE